MSFEEALAIWLDKHIRDPAAVAAKIAVAAGRSKVARLPAEKIAAGSLFSKVAGASYVTPCDPALPCDSMRSQAPPAAVAAKIAVTAGRSKLARLPAAKIAARSLFSKVAGAVQILQR